MVEMLLVALAVISQAEIFSMAEEETKETTVVQGECDMDGYCEDVFESKMSQKTALILGATGETGREVLNKLVMTPNFGQIVSIGRRLVDLPDKEEFKRVQQKIVDFENLDDRNVADFAGVDAAFCCLGTSRGKAGVEGFIKVDHDYVLSAAKHTALNTLPVGEMANVCLCADEA